MSRGGSHNARRRAGPGSHHAEVQPDGAQRSGKKKTILVKDLDNPKKQSFSVPRRDAVKLVGAWIGALGAINNIGRPQVNVGFTPRGVLPLHCAAKAVHRGNREEAGCTGSRCCSVRWRSAWPGRRATRRLTGFPGQSAEAAKPCCGRASSWSRCPPRPFPRRRSRGRSRCSNKTSPTRSSR